MAIMCVPCTELPKTINNRKDGGQEVCVRVGRTGRMRKREEPHLPH